MRCEDQDPGSIRVLLLLTSLHGGGAERVAVQLLNGLPPARFDVRMGLLRATGPYLDEVDPARLMVAAGSGRRFDFDGANRAMYRPDKLLRGLLHAPGAFGAMIESHRPDVVLSFLKGTNLIVWRALAGLSGARPRWIAREGNNTLAVIAEEAPNRLAARLVAALTARAYRSADRVLATSRGLAADLARDLALDPGKVAMIHNPVDCAAIERRGRDPPPERPQPPFVLAAGRLEVQKGHDLLLRAFARSALDRTGDLVILGEGSQRGKLERLVTALGLQGRVHLPGFAADPFAWMRACDLFVQPSRWEGFGSALAEAQAAGAPVLAARCRYGPDEIVAHGITGWLVPASDEAALAAALTRLLADPPLRRRLSAAGRRSVEQFGPATILPRYAALLEATARLPG